MLRKIVFVSVFLLFAAFWLSSERIVNASSVDRVSNQVLVKFKDDAPKGLIESELKKQNGKTVDKINGIGTFVIDVPAQAVDKVIESLSRNPHVEYAESNYIATVLDFPADAPNDMYYAANQWGLENTRQVIAGQTGLLDADIDAQTAWQVTTGSSSAGPVKVAILDTGIDQSHPDVFSKVDLQRNFTDSPSVDDFYGHGTHVSGIVAAVTNNDGGVAGVCPSCRLLNGKVLNDNGSGANSWIANGIIWATDNGAKVINLSLGGPSKSITLERAVNYAWNHNVVVVAAAGNSGNPSKTYPGYYTNVIAVAATNNLDKKAYFSSYGNWVDVAAPGENIFSTFPMHAYKINKSLGHDFASGTSMATPMTAGTAALIWATPYGTSNASVRSRLQSTADKISGTGAYWSSGRINAGKAVSF